MSLLRAKTVAADLLTSLPPFGKGIERLGRSGAVVFAFHRVLPEPEGSYDPAMITSTSVFTLFIDWLSERYRVLPLQDLVQAYQARQNGNKPYCALTFDDGWHDNFLHAFPILHQRRLPATIFLPVRFIGTDRHFWQDRLFFLLQGRAKHEVLERVRRVVHGLPWCPLLPHEQLTFDHLRRILLGRSSREAREFVDRLEEETGHTPELTGRAFMSWHEVRAMQSAGVTFGSHTLDHTLLTHADPATAQQEIEGSRQELAERLGSPLYCFAYPWGAANRLVREQVKSAGYTLALTTEARLVRGPFDSLMLPRVLICDSSLCGPDHALNKSKTGLLLARTALKSRNGQATARRNTQSSASLKAAPEDVIPRNVRVMRRCRRSGASDTVLSQPAWERLRIAFVIDAIDSWEDGGTEQQLAKLVAALDRRYFEPELYFLRPSLHLKAGDFPCPVHVAGSLPEVKWYRPEAFKHLVRLFRARRPHIVQTFFRDATYYGILGAKIAGVPVSVVSVRNAGYWKRFRDRLPLVTINLLAKHWQCNSRSVAKVLRSEDHIPPERIEILPNAIDLSKFVPVAPQERLAAREQLGLPLDAPVFVSVANLWPVKDPATLIEAARRVQQGLPSAQFLLVGDGPLRPSLEAEVVRLGLSDQVRFLGVRKDVRPCLAAADIGLLTSRSEASSNSVLEYMAIGLPAALSDIPGNRDLVGEVFFQPGNAADLAARILGLWSDAGKRYRMSEEYRRQAQNFSLEALAQRLQGYYSGLAAEPSLCFWDSL
jgi:glycosyltransferase involved in cell wall biosynthesis/peptidoglycan/xylan/chitin deacetylase (PgdA/CDA1 family)